MQVLNSTTGILKESFSLNKGVNLPFNLFKQFRLSLEVNTIKIV